MQPDLVAPRTELDFYDQRSTEIARSISALDAWNECMRRPLPGMALAFRLRDAISRRFGVTPIGGFSGKVAGGVKVGDKLDFFLVERVEPEILTLSARDLHLDVITCTTTTPDRQVTVTSSVKVHNWFGRLYMLPVATAHKLIVWAILKRLRQSQAVASGNAPGT